MENIIKSTIEMFYTTDSFSKNDILDIVGESRMNKLKEKYGTPDIRTFVIAHEGVAEGMSTMGKRILLYMKQTVKRVADAIGIGIPAYFQHSKGQARNQIGEVVGRRFINDKNMSYTVAAILIYPEWKEMDLDIASMEAEIEIKGDEVYNVSSVNAIALSNSNIDSPGFPHAKLVAAFEYFTSTGVESTTKGDESRRDDKMNLDEIRKWMKDNNVSVTDILSVEEILSIPSVDSEVKRLLQTKHEHARRLEEKLRRVEEEKNNELDGLLEQVKNYRSKIVEVSSVNTLQTELKSIENAKMREFIEQRAKDRILGQLDKIDDPSKVDEFVRAQVQDVVKDLNTIKELLSATETNPVKDVRKESKIAKPAKSNDDNDVNPLIPNELRRISNG